MSQAILDATDRQILGILQRDARIPNTELADEIGLTPAPTLRRVRRLEEEGVIQRYVALLDPKLVGRELMVMVRVTLDKQTKAGFEQFAQKMQERPEVLECFLCLGDIDYLLKVCVPDLDAYQHFLVNTLAAIPGVRNTASTIVVKQEKHTTSLPLD
ncbi:winged helix-turn-helix transcriptional regulator [Deinococcus sp. HMF7620]|uniref:Winged helix-turn-helix transcriptional regulator n=1 Tax=Deinococcus arboris TaxID=2682977 RepID=A0A7C9M046_9DEIO|nr:MULTISPECIES: Lrp/AsnC family transcriptional regulator [Deinococcus]MBZ9751256.1 Lrp/AsnC family transcriptional regulator [Deinococcus betulae]MVN85802.1 winged helix-turn-helix transcriptional regulator [Deinococcus arboris]